MQTTSPWTQSELIAQAASRGLPADAKAGVARKTDQLTERTVRYYRAQALLDSPADWRGNQPLFSERHLWQLLAIRTLQAAGWSLLQISTWMRSVTDRDLEDVARGSADAIIATPPEMTFQEPRSAYRARSGHWKGPLRTPSPVDVVTTRLMEGVYLVVDHERVGQLTAEDIAQATRNVTILLKESGPDCMKSDLTHTGELNEESEE